jgi:two-component sensor histidine kinase
VGQGLPGRAWEAEQLVLSDSLDSETDVARHEIFAGIGLTCGVALPVSNSGRTYAVLEFFGTAEARLDAEILRLLRTVGTQLGLGMQRKEAAEQREILRREVAHRVGNSLAVLSSIYRSCARSARSVEELNASFLGRIMAVSRASRMTLSESLSDQNLKLLLKEATGLLPQQERIIIDAPDMTLASEAVLPLSLILHELSTNALKHGSVAHGGEVFLRVDVAPQCNEFRLSWIEQRELSVDLPPETEQRSGYGSTLIRAMVESRLNGSFTRTLTRDGFRFDAVLPLSEMQALHPAGEVSAASPAEAR